MPISQPPLIEVPFAESGLKNAIPANANNVTGNAGFDLGFPPINLTAVAAGGIPPYGQDMNGILYEITQNIQFQQTGTPTVYDPAFAAAITGYPEGAKLLKLDGSGWWINTVSGNTTDPDSGGAGWFGVSFADLANVATNASLPFRGIQVYDTAGTYTWTVPAGVTRAWVTVVGGGGGGGTSAAAGGGGGGGGMAIKLCDLNGIDSVEIAVGSGAPAGGNGATSSFGTFCSATGGGNGGAGGSGGHGGNGIGGDINTSLGPGATGSSNGGGWSSGTGGGPGGNGQASGTSTTGASAISFGGGGAGGTLSGVGGNGFRGYVMIQW